jgi:hypothetical protein
MVLLAAETGLRWGKLVALRPQYLDTATAALTVQDVYVEVSKKNAPTGQRMILRTTPRTTNPAPCASPENLTRRCKRGSLAWASA